MITIASTKDLSATSRIRTYYGLSTDTKPTNEGENGSVWWEIDTGKCYIYNEANSTWVEVV